MAMTARTEATPDAAPLLGRRVLVTGGSSGIGASVARTLTTAGARVALVARRADELERLVDELGPDAAVAVPADLTDDDAATAAVHTAARRLGGLDALVNAAGVMHAGPVTDPGATPDEWRRMFALNVVALLVVTRAAAEHLRAGTAPAVVNVSSMSGRRVPTAAGAVYAATKHAVHAASDGLRMELAPDGVRVTTVAPGFVRTGIVDDWPDGPLRDRYAERLETVGLDPSVVADAVRHVLATPAGTQVVEYALTSVTQ
jgi:NADP-dependent 3-hydroxy acid dehydrogenase YdfG